jgi:hypothetical protein
MARPVRNVLCLAVVVVLGLSALAGIAEQPARQVHEIPFRTPPDLKTVPQEKWDQIDKSVKFALKWLASRQQGDGSIPTHIAGQPGVTSLGVLAFLSAGEKPGIGEHGQVIDRAIDYVLNCQRGDDLFIVDSTDKPIPPFEHGSHTGLYNHAISCLMLCEAYGSTDTAQRRRMQEAINRGIALARRMQLRKQPYPVDQGGFRYFKTANLERGNGDADLSVTGWFVMFYRSAKNAGFDIPEEYIDEATAYVRRCYDPQRKSFYYGLNGNGHTTTARGMTGAGVVCLTLAGKPDEEIARAAGQWILEHPFNQYGGFEGFFDRFHYGAYYCSQAMFLLGGDYWSKFYPTTADTLLANQNADGSWPPEQKFSDGLFGSEYTTALSVLTLATPYQLLPIHQR